MPRGPSALWRRSLVLVSCGLLAAGLLTSCTSHSTAAASQHPRPAPAIGPPPMAVLPAGAEIAGPGERRLRLHGPVQRPVVGF